MNPRLLDALLLALIGLVVASVWLLGAELPPSVASHFGVDGRADSHMARDTYRVLFSLLAGGLPLVLGFFAGPLLGADGQRLNIPHKAYWLSPERRAATLATVRGRLRGLAALLALFLGAVHGLLVQANREQPPRLDGAALWPVTAVFVAAVVLWAWSLGRCFRRRP